MARNQEKSHSMLNRWLSMQREISGQAPKKRTGTRPYLASMADNLGDAEHWRENLIRELGKTVLLLQNGTAITAVFYDPGSDNLLCTMTTINHH